MITETGPLKSSWLNTTVVVVSGTRILMAVDEIVANNLAEHTQIVNLVAGELSLAISTVGLSLARVIEHGGTVYWCGNGGSASDSQHLAAELVGRYRDDRQALPSVALNTDTSVLTCIGNDFGFEEVFSRQVEALGRPGDVLVGISTSGDSPNILRAFKAATRLRMTTVGLLGRDGGLGLSLVDEAIVVPSNSTARIQECHILVGHILCEIVEEELGLV